MSRTDREAPRGSGAQAPGYLQFESLECARQWLESPEYKDVKQLRHRAAVSNMVAIEGV
jgi:uncharacterized protein (DUF1330 family)